MRPAQKLQAYRKQIRREYLHSLFAQKRIKLLQGYKKQEANNDFQMDCEKQVLNLGDLETMSVIQLKRIAALVQNQRGIKVVHKAQYQNHFLKYLGKEYINTDEQFYATYIFCNLYFDSIAAPSEHLTRELIRLLQDAEMRTLQNIFFLIGNAIHDYPFWLDDIMGETYKFGEKLFILFGRFPKSTIEYLTQLTHLVFKVIQKKGKHSSFMKLRQPLLRMIMQEENPAVRQLLLTSIYSYYCLVKYFPKELAPTVVKARLLQRLLKLWSFFNSRKIVCLTLQVIQLVMEEITVQDFQDMVIPSIIRLAEQDFNVGQKNANFQPRQLKLVTYKLVQKALQQGKLTSQYFSSLKLAEILLQQLKSSEDEQILICLFSIFVQITLSTNNLMLKQQLKRILERLTAMHKSFQLSVYLHECERMLM